MVNLLAGVTRAYGSLHHLPKIFSVLTDFSQVHFIFVSMPFAASCGHAKARTYGFSGFLGAATPRRGPTAIRQAQDKKKYDELTQEDKDQKAEAEKAVPEQKDKKQAVIADYAKGNSIVHQLIDLALLQNGMLKGEALDKFLKRSVELIK